MSTHRRTVLFAISGLVQGGAEQRLIDVANRLDRQRFRVALCSLHAAPLAHLVQSDIPIYSNLTPNGRDPRLLQRVIRVIQQEKPDICFIVGRTDVGVWGRLAARVLRVPVLIQSLHLTGRYDTSIGKRVIEQLNRLLDPLTDCFVAVARSHKEYLVSVDKLPEDRIVVIYNGVDGLRFRPDLQVAAKRNELELPEQVPVVGIVARFFPEKAHDVFLAAATVIKQAIPDVHFLLVGDGPRRAGIQELARQLNLDRQCRFTGDRADIPELLCLMNVSVLCSDPVVETFSNTVLESMAAERPVVATRVGSLSEAIVDGETGLLLPPRQPEALAQAVIALLNDPARARQMGVAGRQRVQRLFDLDKMVHERELLFENLLQRKQNW